MLSLLAMVGKRWHGSVVGFLGTLLAACATLTESPESGAAATTTREEPTWNNDLLQWADTPYQALPAVLDGALPAPLEDANPLAQRMRAWTERIDSVVRADVRAFDESAAGKIVATMLGTMIRQ